MKKKYIKSELSNSIRRFISEQEKDLKRICRSIWDFTNPKGETFLFASFTTGNFPKDRDRLIITLAYFDPRICQFRVQR